MDEISKFQRQVRKNIQGLGADRELRELSNRWMELSSAHGYTYNFSWQDRPIIQYPQDMVAMQELIWSARPDLIIEAGIAHGGSLIFSASMLALLDLSDAIEVDTSIRARESARKVLGIDIDIRAHNREAIEAHPMASRISMIEGSSIAEETVAQVREVSQNYDRVLVMLDSNHTHTHVLAELEAYAPMTSVNSYCVVFDTAIENMPEDMFPDRPWGPGDNPWTAVQAFLAEHAEFEVDELITNKLMITVALGGYLKRTR